MKFNSFKVIYNYDKLYLKSLRPSEQHAGALQIYGMVGGSSVAHIKLRLCDKIDDNV